MHIPPELILRNPKVQLRRLRDAWQAQAEWWVFGYASLLWRPEFEAVEERPARLYGWHRALQMKSRVNRGTPQQPGLVFALLPGGHCDGAVYRLHPTRRQEELKALWAREQPTGVYDALLLPCRTAQGRVRALTFTLSPRSAACMPAMGEAQRRHILSHAVGRYGSTRQYLVQTAQELDKRGIVDADIRAWMRLAECCAEPGPPCPAATPAEAGAA
jgi:glutathione-specific gamma-glutamylcyclotransferase